MVQLEQWRPESESGKLVVFMLDECHLLWGDLCGYVWGKTDRRIVVPIANERQRQTYFGALNYHTKEFLVQSYDRGNWEQTIAFLQYLQQQCPNQRIAVIWDGASYHRSGEIKAYLESLNNNGKSPASGLRPMLQNKIRLKTFGYKPNDGFESVITCVNRFEQ